MDLGYAIERHRQPLLGIVAGLCAMIGLAGGGVVERVAWPIYRKVSVILRPAESAVRRLIIVMAQGITVTPRAARPSSARRRKPGKRKRRLEFQLFDRRLRQDAGMERSGPKVPRPEPRIHFFGFDPRSPLHRQSAPAAPAPKPKPKRQETANAATLSRRLAAIQLALQDLPRQALRYARWRARTTAQPGQQPRSILRRGSPPGFRRDSRHEVHEILAECQALARSLPDPNSS